MTEGVWISDVCVSMSKLGKIRLFLLYFLGVMCIVLDQYTKHMVVKNMEYFGSIEVIKNFFSFYYVRNTGSAFSMFADKAWGIYLLSGISIVCSVILIYFIFKSAKKSDAPSTWGSISLVLLFAGAAGNLIDRIRLNYVVDFLRFDFGSYTFPIFNVADICAVVGTAILVFLVIFKPQGLETIFGENNNAKQN